MHIQIEINVLGKHRGFDGISILIVVLTCPRPCRGKAARGEAALRAKTRGKAAALRALGERGETARHVAAKPRAAKPRII